MRLENEFTVPAPVETVWPVLLDIARVAECLPGATIEPERDDGVFHGRMRVKLGPVTTTYEGFARLQDVDDDTHTASIAVNAREAKGQGTASAVITNRLEAVNGSTRVSIGTDLAITGRQAQFGRGIMQDVASRMMGEFAQRFEQQLREGGARAGGSIPQPPPAARSPQTEQPEPLDLGNVLAASPQVRLAVGGGLLALVVALLGLAMRRNRKGITVQVRIRP